MEDSDSEHSDGEEDVAGVELGFRKQSDVQESWKLHRCYFPSKFGGKPAWLDPQNLPSQDEMKCNCCGKPLVFLLQIYAPNDDNEDAFHRTVFIFCCKTETCYLMNSNQSFRVFRCQLKRENEYYNVAPPEYDSPTFYKSCKEFGNICHACGCRGNKVCSRCREVSYCSKEHQALDWKRHKLYCGKEQDSSNNLGNSLLFPEDEIAIESEESHCAGVSNDDKNAEVPSTNSDKGLDGTFSPSELEQFANFIDTDKKFAKFRKTIAHSLDQILRYDKAGIPLWCTTENQLRTVDIPKCHCGSPRQFEFQIMPQLLNHLGIHTSLQGPSIDWGILAIYTCSIDCIGSGTGYIQEYLHKQDFSQTVAN